MEAAALRGLEADFLDVSGAGLEAGDLLFRIGRRTAETIGQDRKPFVVEVSAGITPDVIVFRILP